MTLHPAPDDKHSRLKRWQKNKAALLEEIQHIEQDLAELKSRLKNTDKHIRWDQLDEQERFKKPAITRKRLMDSMRMIAYRTETAMTTLITGHSVDTAAARRLLQDLFVTEADIFPDYENRRLLISLHRSARPAVDQNLNRLFEHLNDAELTYPGTDLRIVYQLVGAASTLASQQNGVTSTSTR